MHVCVLATNWSIAWGHSSFDAKRKIISKFHDINIFVTLTTSCSIIFLSADDGIRYFSFVIYWSSIFAFYSLVYNWQREKPDRRKTIKLQFQKISRYLTIRRRVTQWKIGRSSIAKEKIPAKFLFLIKIPLTLFDTISRNWQRYLAYFIT